MSFDRRAPLILASASPRRRELLNAAGLPCEVISPGIPEADAHPGGPHLLALHNAGVKVREVARRHPSRLVMAADTVVGAGERLLGKPAGLGEAREMLRWLSGRVHEVHTGVHIIAGPVGAAFCETSRVRFRRLTADDIERYLGLVDTLDKAGGYAAQEHGDLLIENIEGSFSNVVGLPVERCVAALQRYFRFPA